MNNFKSTILSLSLVLLPLLGACSHDGNDDATLPVAKGGEPLIFNIAPKESFVDANPNTRATVDETTGAMTWEPGDRIFVTVVVHPVEPTVFYTLVRTAAGTWDSYEGLVPTRGLDNNVIDLATQTKETPTYPLGLTNIDVVTTCFDGETKFGEISTSTTTILPVTGSTADAMNCIVSNIAPNVPINLEMKHMGNRLVFTGLTPNTAYAMSGILFCTYFDHYGAGIPSPIFVNSHDFISDVNGNYVYCSIGESGGALVLKEKATDTTVFTATIPAGKAKSYTLVKGETGPINPGNNPDLLTPDPIVANNLVSQINGYYITAPDADINKTYTWDGVATTNPCTGHGNWRMPTMKDWEAIAGWQIGHPWTQDVTGGPFTMPTHLTGHALFPTDKKYLSSDARSTGTLVWAFYISNTPDANYTSVAKTLAVNVRCVQK